MKLTLETTPEQDASLQSWIARWNINRGSEPVPADDQFLSDRCLEFIDAQIGATIKAQKEDLKTQIDQANPATLADLSAAVAATIQASKGVVAEPPIK